jgi:uncharacterized protein YbaA (DUF1428 family)
MEISKLLQYAIDRITDWPGRVPRTFLSTSSNSGQKQEISMKRYVDGFVFPVKKKNVKAYRKMAELGCKIWMEYGAISYYECIGENLKTPWGWTFPRMCKLKPGETVVFSFIVYNSKSHRNKVNSAVMKDPRMNTEGVKMPFDMKRFAVGGFSVLVQSK